MKLLHKQFYQFVLFILYMLCMCYIYFSNVAYDKPAFDESLLEKLNFLIDTPGYQLPDFDPFDKSVLNYIEPVPVGFDCSLHKRPLTTGLSNFTYGNDPTLHCVLLFHTEFIPDYGVQTTSCCYSFMIIDGLQPNYPDRNFGFGECIPILEAITNISDHHTIRVICTTDEQIIYKNAHIFVHLKDSNPTFNNSKERGSDDPLSLVVYGIDSVSRINMQRYMKKTLASISNFDYIDLKGFNKIKDNTFPNNILLLTGQEKVPWYDPMFFDHLDIVWKEFSQMGYSTAYGEDCGDLGMFHYLTEKKGFMTPPTDYYPMPSILALEKYIGWKGSHVWFTRCSSCLGHTSSMDILLKYAYDLSQVLRDKPFFSFIWSSSVTHDRLPFAGLVDEPLANFLDMTSIHWNHTIVLLLADHGLRYGSIRKTFIGKIEENLPLGYFLLPNWFKNRYPIAYKNLQFNQQRLVTQYDLHETMDDIAHSRFMDNDYVSQDHEPHNLNHKLSLFKKIPETRTCSDALIPVHYCSGLRAAEIPLDDSRTVLPTKFVVQTLNLGLQNFSECVQFTQFQINKAFVIKFFKNSKEDYKYHNVSLIELKFTTYPGGAELECLVETKRNRNGDSNSYMIKGTVSRLNAYIGQSECITDVQYVKYCYCKKRLSVTQLYAPNMEHVFKVND